MRIFLFFCAVIWFGIVPVMALIVLAFRLVSVYDNLLALLLIPAALTWLFGVVITADRTINH